MLRVIIIDDEPPARRLLSRMCAAHDGVEVVGTGASVADAEELIETLSPDAAFLDINLGDGCPNGFAIPQSSQQPLDVVFVTAHADHALLAFEHAAVDYLLKPVDPQRLICAIARLTTRRKNMPASKPPPQRIAIRIEGAVQFYALSDIAMLQAEGDYTRAFLISGRDVLVGRRLGQLEATFKGSTLVRISRFMMVNHTAIQTIQGMAGGKQTVMLRGLSDGVIVGRSAARRLRSWTDEAITS